MAGLRAPAGTPTANSAEGTAERAAAAVSPAPRTGETARPTMKLGGAMKRGDTATVAALIVIGAVLLLVALRFGLAGALGD